MMVHFFAAAIILLSMGESVLLAFAETAAPRAVVDLRNDAFALHDRSFDGDFEGVAAANENRAADLLPRHDTHTVTTIVTVTECESTPLTSVLPPVPDTSGVESPPPATATPEVSDTTPVEPTPPAVSSTISSANPPRTTPSEENPQSSEEVPPVSSAPPASETSGAAPPPESELSSAFTEPPPAFGSTSITAPTESIPGMASSEGSSFPPSSARSTRASTTTAPAAGPSSPPPAPNTGDHVIYNKAIVAVGMIFAAIAAI